MSTRRAAKRRETSPSTSNIKRLKLDSLEVYDENELCFDLFQLYSEENANRLYHQLEKEIVYLDREKTLIKIFNKEYKMPRSVAAFGDEKLSYKFSNVRVYAKPWTPALLEIKKDVEEATNLEFNFVLVNRYSDGKDHMGAHKDDEKDLEENYPIASVSLGQDREFIFSRKNFPSVKITLDNGSLLEMKPPTNTYWYHRLPRCSAKNPRINLTFRNMKLETKKFIESK